MKYMHFNGTGQLDARYDDAINARDIPGDAVRVDDDTFGRSINETDGIWMRDTATGEITKRPLQMAPAMSKTRFSVLEFMDRLTPTEQLAIKQATYGDAEVGLTYDRFLAAEYIDLKDARVAQGLALYVGKGLLAETRKTELLTPMSCTE